MSGPGIRLGLGVVDHVLKLPTLARTYRQSHLVAMSGMAPTPDFRVRMSGILSLSSGLPSGPDVADSPCVRGKMTQRRPTGDQVDGHQAYRTSVTSVLPAWGETHYRTNLPGAAELAIIMGAGAAEGMRYE